MLNKEIAAIKKGIEELIGEVVRLETNKGRKKVAIRNGIIEKTYPNLFTVRITDKFDKERTVSYTYSDVLIHNVLILPTQEIEINSQVC